MTAAGAVPETAAQVGRAPAAAALHPCTVLHNCMPRERVYDAFGLPRRATERGPTAAAAAAAAACRCCLPLLATTTLLAPTSQAVLVPSEQLPEDAVTIRGYDFNQGCDLNGLLESMLRTGLQATALGQAIHEVNRMVGPAATAQPPRNAARRTSLPAPCPPTMLHSLPWAAHRCAITLPIHTATC